MRTKEEYQADINLYAEKRKELLTALVNTTKTEIDEDAVLDLAYDAYDALDNLRKVRTEMRKHYPPLCNCNCHEDRD